MTIRAAFPDDAPSIALVSVSSWRTSYAHILPESYLRGLSVARRATRIRELLLAGVPYWVAESDGKIVGFTSVGPNDEQAVPADGELKALYVIDEYHGRHIGRQLLETAVEHLLSLGHASMCAFAFRENHRAGNFYVKWGAERHDQGTYTLDNVDYPDQSYFWPSLTELRERLASAQKRDLTV